MVTLRCAGVYRSAAPQPELSLHLAGPGGERDGRLLQQHRGIQPGDGGDRVGPGGERGDAGARDPGGAGRTGGGGGARPLRPAADHAGQRFDPGGGGAGLHRRGAASFRMAAVHAERAADVRFAVLHQRTRGDSAGDRQSGRIAHGQLAHPDHPVGYAHGGHHAGRVRGSAAGFFLGVRAQLAVVRLLGLCGVAVACAGRLRGGARAEQRGGPAAALARIRRGAGVHPRDAAGVLDRHGVGGLGDGRWRGADPVYAVRRAGVRARRGGHRDDLGLCWCGPADRRRDWALGGTAHRLRRV